MSNDVKEGVDGCDGRTSTKLCPSVLLQILAHTTPTGQDFLESSFPAKHPRPTTAAIASASGEKALDRSAHRNSLAEPPAPLNKRNTATKFALDQSVGAAVNTLLFSVFMHSIRAAMVGGRGAVDYARVDWRVVEARARAEFWPIMTAGLRFWPFVSAFNFGVVKSVEGRNLVGSLAGMAWGVYMSLFAAG